MEKLAPFLAGIDTILFDMDGVITSEQNYWDIAALTVYEMLFDKLYYGSGTVGVLETLAKTKEIRAEIFAGDKLIVALKERGVNSNWDLAYVTFCFLVSGKVKSGADFLDYVNANETLLAFDLYEQGQKLAAKALPHSLSACGRNGLLWNRCQYVFQEWYLGSGLYPSLYHQAPQKKDKPGLYKNEVPIVPVRDLHRVLSALKAAGLRLGIGTGRPKFEIDQPLRLWDIAKYFDAGACVNYTDIMDAERAFLARGQKVELTKPHPYIFLKGMLGRSFCDEDIVLGRYDKSLAAKTLVVGDAGADILAAKAMGAPFLAVLTGVSGEKARGFFEENGAHVILPDIRHMLQEA